MSLAGFAERLRAARAAADLTQIAVSAALGYTPATIANWEHGRTEPSATDLARLAALYRVSLDWLLTGRAHLEHRFEVCPHGVPVAERARCGLCDTA